MKRLVISLALFVLMAAGTAHGDTPSLHPEDLFRFNLSCNFPSSGCSADARILLDRVGLQSDAVHPEWFGNLLSVSCADAGGLISASAATLYRIFDGDDFRWAIYNSDGTVRVLLKDSPFEGKDKTVDARLQVSGQGGGVSGSCDVKARDVRGR